MKKTESQNKKILKHLQSGYHIDAFTAMRQFGVFRLAARIHNLKENGHPIKTKLKHVGSMHFAEYSL